jgi:hypothetical protein
MVLYISALPTDPGHQRSGGALGSELHCVCLRAAAPGIGGAIFDQHSGQLGCSIGRGRKWLRRPNAIKTGRTEEILLQKRHLAAPGHS